MIDNAKVLDLARAAHLAWEQYESAADNLIQKRLTLRQLSGYSDDLAAATVKLCEYLLTNVPLERRPHMETNSEITMHRSELLPGGNGARIAFSDDYPDRQFLIIPRG